MTADSGRVITESEVEKLTAWIKKSKQARSIIGASISAVVITYIEGIDDPSNMWRILEENITLRLKRYSYSQ
jgi:hypothetical protein